MPCPVRLPPHCDPAADAGSAANPVSIAGNVIGRDPKSEFLRRQKGWHTGAAYTLTTRQRDYVLAGDGIRRFTVTEMERMMGFRDGYTAVMCNGRPALDSARQYALGNSWPVNCARFVCERIGKCIRGTL